MRTVKLLFAVLLATGLFAQIDTTVGMLGCYAMPSISTDRPDFTESANVVPVGWLQVEAGGQFQEHRIQYAPFEITQTTFTPILLRFGLNKKFEVRATLQPQTDYVSDQGFLPPYRLMGLQPMGVGFKYKFGQGFGWRPKVAWESTLSFPYLARGDYLAQQQARMVFHAQRIAMEKSWKLTPVSLFTLSGNVGVSGGLVGQGGFINAGLHSISAAFAMNKTSVFVEQFSTYTVAGTVLQSTPYVDFGIIQQLNNDLQLDLYFGQNISPWAKSYARSTGYFVGAGISYRYPLALHFM